MVVYQSRRRASDHFSTQSIRTRAVFYEGRQTSSVIEWGDLESIASLRRVFGSDSLKISPGVAVLEDLILKATFVRNVCGTRNALIFASAYQTHPERIIEMTDVAKNVKGAVDSAATAAKTATDKTLAAGQKAAESVGNAVKSTGQKIKDAGK